MLGLLRATRWAAAARTATHQTARPASGLKIALALTASFMAAEVIGGLISGTLALLADAAHNLGG